MNVVLGKVLKPQLRERDTHNLGKSLLAQLIDFCLVKKRSPTFFLFQHEQFQPFVFFLEIQLQEGSYMTVRRSVSESSKPAFAYHTDQIRDWSLAADDQWTHWAVPFEKARELLDAALDLDVVKPWSYRNALAYALRTQSDYDDPFRLSKHVGKHAEWKPFLAHILGLDSELVSRIYDIEATIEEQLALAKSLRNTAGGSETLDQVRGVVEIAQRDVEQLSKELADFNLGPSEARTTRALVGDVDKQIAVLNDERYAVETDKARIIGALEQRISVNLQTLESIFAQANIYFGEQIRRDYSALERFNKELVEERDGYLRDELSELDAKARDLEAELSNLNEKRTEALQSLSNAEAIASYKALTRRLSHRQAEFEILRLRQKSVEELLAIRQAIRELEAEKLATQARLERSLVQTEGVYGDIRRSLDDVVFRVIGRHGNMYTEVNKEGHPDFHAEIVDSEGQPTSAAEGFSYGRLLCIAFDMAMLRTYSSRKYPHFVYHDGVLETLDDRKKLNLLDTIRAYASVGTQHIITVIDAELPVDARGERISFGEEEIILRLHDVDDSGRLFHMPAW
ncbi:MAG: DUF2326 domain-containing protein [Gemmatimonadaceae bacterium]